MKPILLFFTVMHILTSCHKNSNTPQPPSVEDPTITALKAHVWLLDSLERVHNGVVVDSLIE